MEIDELIDKANEQCMRIKGYIQENEDMFNIMDLKLYDAFYYECDKMKDDYPSLCNNEMDSYFNRFCESTYNQFLEWCTEEYINFDKMSHYVGRTSKFYLYETEFVQRDNHNEINWQWTMQNIVDEVGYSLCYSLFDFDKDGNINRESLLDDNESFYTKEELIEEIKPALQYISDSLYDDFMVQLEDTKKVYDYIKDIKDNQVEYFKDYLDCCEEDLEMDRE